MTLHLHHLRGCSPTPLANYLKALGILRLVAEQADPAVRGWWQDEHFCLLSSLSKEELEKFFLEKYEPTPVFNPWGARSGFYKGSPEKTSRAALVEIEKSTSDRLKNFRQAIAEIRTIVEQQGNSKPATDEAEDVMISAIHSKVRGAASEWLATVMADLGDSFHGPAILGTGGNEGSGSYTASFLAAVVAAIVHRSWDEHIGACLWGTSSRPGNAWDGKFSFPHPTDPKKQKSETVNQPFRQFMPESEATPWDLLLAFEGAIAVRSGVTRRSEADKHRFLTSPFYFESVGIGAPSSSEYDEFALNKGKKNPGRGEQWFPLWQAPLTFSELDSLLTEGRCSTGKRSARTPLDAVRAIQSIGITRGIKEFLRYGYLQRNNLATHFAVPLGRVRVEERIQTRLIDDLATWMAHLHRLARKKNAPARLGIGYRKLANAVLAALNHDPQPVLWQAVLLAAVEIEMMQATGTAIEAQPMPPLRPEWIEATFDPELAVEWRLALALGSAAAKYFKFQPTDSVRGHCLPLDNESFWPRFRTSEKRLVRDPRVVVSGRGAISDCAAIVERRLIEASQKGERRLPLVAAQSCGAQLGDLAAFAAGNVDVERTFNLARAFMAVQWSKFEPKKHRPNTIASDDQPPEAWLALRLSCLPWPLEDGRRIPAESSIVRRLMAGDTANATEIALRRLRAAGVRVPLQAATTDPESSRLWAAALVFPIHRDSAQKAAALLDPSLKGQVHA